jgi:hypothetical protein
MEKDYTWLMGTVVAALIAFFSGAWAYRKNKADASGVVVDNAIDLMDQYRTSLKECQEKNTKVDEILARAIIAESRVEQLTVLVTNLQEQVSALEDQLYKLGQVPKTKKEKNQNGSKI